MSTIKVNNVIPPNAGEGVTIDGLQMPTAGPLSNRNLIINGGMVVSQRGNPSTGHNVYATDRFRVFNDASASSFTVSQSSDAPVGFQNSAKVVVSSAVTPAGGAGVLLRYQVEGYDAAQLDLGTAAAKTFTLSFWVKSTLTGTFAGAFANGAFDRYYVYEYTINAANTWEHKTVTIAGDTTGTWEKTNGDGMRIYWDLGSGSGFVQTAGSWSSGTGLKTSNSTDLCQNAGAEFYLTGVQLEVGSKATPFEHRSYGDELQRCMRYCQAYTTGRIAAGSFTDVVTGDKGHCIQYLPVAMRTTPTLFSHTKGSLVWEGRAWHAVTATPIITTESSPSIIHWTLGTSSNIINSTENGSIPTMWGNGASAIIQAEL